MNDKVNKSSTGNNSKISLCRESFDRGLEVFGWVLWYGFYALMFIALGNLILFPFGLNFINDKAFTLISGIMSIIMICMFELLGCYTPLKQINNTFHIFGWKD